MAGFRSLRDWAAGGISDSLIETKSLQLRLPPPHPPPALARSLSGAGPLRPSPGLPLPRVSPTPGFPLPPLLRSGNETKGTAAPRAQSSFLVAGQSLLEWRRLCFAARAGVCPREQLHSSRESRVWLDPTILLFSFLFLSFSLFSFF